MLVSRRKYIKLLHEHNDLQREHRRVSELLDLAIEDNKHEMVVLEGMKRAVSKSIKVIVQREADMLVKRMQETINS